MHFSLYKMYLSLPLSASSSSRFSFVLSVLSFSPFLLNFHLLSFYLLASFLYLTVIFFHPRQPAGFICRFSPLPFLCHPHLLVFICWFFMYLFSYCFFISSLLTSSFIFVFLSPLPQWKWYFSVDPEAALDLLPPLPVVEWDKRRQCLHLQ